LVQTNNTLEACNEAKLKLFLVPNTTFLLVGQFVSSPFSCFIVRVFLYLFSTANISPVRFVLHLQDWWCVRIRETSFPVNKLWLIYLPPSLWPITMKN